MGMNRPRSWWTTFLLALAVIVASIGITIVVQAVILMLSPDMPPADQSRFDVLRGNLPLLIAGLVSVWVTAAFGEEMLVRGFMMNRFANLFGSTRGTWIVTLIVSSVVFGLMHVYQGPMGVIAQVWRVSYLAAPTC